MTPENCVEKLQSFQEFFQRSTSVLKEEDSTFAPTPGAFTAAQQVAHVAQTIAWFTEGAFRPEGFDLDFAAHATALGKVTSLTEAREWLERSFHSAKEIMGSKTAAELAQPLPAGPIMGGAPRYAILSGIEDHTAHHRGALSVYARLRGHEPKMPYMDA